MNMVVSDAISLDRAVKDTRLKECKHWNYPENLPSASVIVVFHNEGLSVKAFCLAKLFLGVYYLLDYFKGSYENSALGDQPHPA